MLSFGPAHVESVSPVDGRRGKQLRPRTPLVSGQASRAAISGQTSRGKHFGTGILGQVSRAAISESHLGEPSRAAISGKHLRAAILGQPSRRANSGKHSRQVPDTYGKHLGAAISGNHLGQPSRFIPHGPFLVLATPGPSLTCFD